MKILICDDEPVFINYIKEKCPRNADICEYTCLPSEKDDLSNIDIAFLDIEIGSESGFSLARRLVSENPSCIIEFFTSHHELSLDGYVFNAFRYILKSEPQERIESRIKEAFTEYSRRTTPVKIEYKGSLSYVNASDILYIEAVMHHCIIYTKKGHFEWSQKMNTIQENFAVFGFIRCHKGYIVNLSEVQSLKNKTFILYDNSQIPIGRSYYPNAKEKYILYKAGDIT